MQVTPGKGDWLRTLAAGALVYGALIAALAGDFLPHAATYCYDTRRMVAPNFDKLIELGDATNRPESIEWGALAAYYRTGEVRPFPDLPEAAIYPMYAPTENLVDVVLGTAPNRSPATLGWSAMKLIEGACESVRTGANVMVTGKS